MSRYQFDLRRDVRRDRGMRDGAAGSRGLEVEAEVAWGGRGFAAVRGGAGRKLPNIEMRPGVPKAPK